MVLLLKIDIAGLSYHQSHKVGAYLKPGVPIRWRWTSSFAVPIRRTCQKSMRAMKTRQRTRQRTGHPAATGR